MSTVEPLSRELDRFVEQRAPPVHVSGIEHARGQLTLLQCLPHQLETAGSVAQVQVQDAGLAGHDSGDVAFGGDSQQLIERRLARAMIADRHFTDADQRLDEHEVAANAARERGGWHVISAGVSVRVESLLAQRIDCREQFTGPACDIVGAEQPDDRGDASRGETRQRHRRDASTKSRFAAATCDVHVPVDQAGNRLSSCRVDDSRDACGAERAARAFRPRSRVCGRRR